jgi:hypothetical protein
MSFAHYLHFVLSPLPTSHGRLYLTLDRSVSMAEAGDCLQAIGRMVHSLSQQGMIPSDLTGPLPLYDANGERIGKWGFETSNTKM